MATTEKSIALIDEIKDRTNNQGDEKRPEERPPIRSIGKFLVAMP